MSLWSSRKKFFFFSTRFVRFHNWNAHIRVSVSLDTRTHAPFFACFGSISFCLVLCLSVSFFVCACVSFMCRSFAYTCESSEKYELDKMAKWKSPVLSFSHSAHTDTQLLLAFNRIRSDAFLCVSLSQAKRFCISRG